MDNQIKPELGSIWKRKSNGNTVRIIELSEDKITYTAPWTMKGEITGLIASFLNYYVLSESQ